MYVNSHPTTQPNVHQTGSGCYLVKLASPWIVLATSVRLRETRCWGSVCVRPNMLGERIAGHRNRRKIHELMSWRPTSMSAMALLWHCRQRSRSDMNTWRSSLSTHTFSAVCLLFVQHQNFKLQTFRSFVHPEKLIRHPPSHPTGSIWHARTSNWAKKLQREIILQRQLWLRVDDLVPDEPTRVNETLTSPL